MEYEDFFERLNQYGIKFLRLQFVDITGRLKNVAVTSENVGTVLNKTMSFFYNEQKVLFEPDLESLAVLPWRPREGAVGRVFGNLLLKEKEDAIICSRKFFNNYTYPLEVAAEFSFFLSEKAGEKVPVDKASLWDVSPLDLGENLRRDVVLTLEKMGIGVSFSGHGIKPGEQVLGLKAVKVNKFPDIFTTTKFVVKTTAERHGLTASFFPYHYGKPGLFLKLNFFGEKIDLEKTYQRLKKVFGEAEIILRPLINDYSGQVAEVDSHIFFSGNNLTLNLSPLANPYLVLSLIAWDAASDLIYEKTARDFGEALRRYSSSKNLQDFFQDLFWEYLKVKQRSYYEFWAKVHTEDY